MTHEGWINNGVNEEGGQEPVRVDVFNHKLGVAIGGAIDSPVNDQFGRIRVSQPTTIFDSKQLYNSQGEFWDDQQVSGGGTSSSHNPNKAATTMSVSASTAGKRVRQTFQWFNYQPAKSQLIFMTFTLGAAATGITREVGQFNDANGLFLRQTSTGPSFVRRSNVTGTPVNEVVAQADWNIDKLDGTGTSDYTLDLSKAQILIIDYEWLGVGRVRMGFVIDGKIIYCHQFTHANILTTVYMSTPNLPLRYSIENDGTGAASSMDHICSSIISEGGVDDNGILRYGSTVDNGHINANTAGATYFIFGVRLKSTALGGGIKIENITLLNLTADDYEWSLIFNPTIAGTALTWISAGTYSSIEVAPGENATASTQTITAGVAVAGGLVKASGNSGDVSLGVPNALRLGSFISGTPTVLALGVTPLSSNADMHGGMTVRELA